MKRTLFLLLMLVPAVTWANDPLGPVGVVTEITAAPTQPGTIAVRVENRLYVTQTGGAEWSLVTGRRNGVEEESTPAMELSEPALFAEKELTEGEEARSFEDMEANESSEDAQPAEAFYFVVDDRGVVTFWDETAGRVVRCRRQGECRNLTDPIQVRAMVCDRAGNVWAADRSRLYRISPEGKTAMRALAGIEQLLYARDAAKVAVRTAQAIKWMNESTAEETEEEALPQSALWMDHYQNHLFTLHRGSVEERNAAGKSLSRVRVPPGATAFVADSRAVWVEVHGRWVAVGRDGGHQFQHFSTPVSHATRDAAGTVWLATAQGPMKFEPMSTYADTHPRIRCALKYVPARPLELVLRPRLPVPRPMWQSLLPTIAVTTRRSQSMSRFIDSTYTGGQTQQAERFFGISLVWRFKAPSFQYEILREQAARKQNAADRQRMGLQRALRQYCEQAPSHGSLFSQVMNELRRQQLQSRLTHLGY